MEQSAHRLASEHPIRDADAAVKAVSKVIRQRIEPQELLDGSHRVSRLTMLAPLDARVFSGTLDGIAADLDSPRPIRASNSVKKLAIVCRRSGLEMRPCFRAMRPAVRLRDRQDHPASPSFCCPVGIALLHSRSRSWCSSL